MYDDYPDRIAHAALRHQATEPDAAARIAATRMEIETRIQADGNE